MDETPLIQQYLQLRSEFMGYLYAMTRDADLAEEVYQNAAVVVMEKAGGQNQFGTSVLGQRRWCVVRRFTQFVQERFPQSTVDQSPVSC